MVTLKTVIPCYNEEEVLPETTKQMCALYESLLADGLISQDSRIVYVDDGSRDKTWEMISGYCEDTKWVEGIKLAHNAGHQKALLAGLMTVKDSCDCAVSADADLQDDISIIREFLIKHAEGYDVVYGVRNKRDTDTWFKRNTAVAFYKLMKNMGVDIVFNHADYRLMSRRALEGLARFREVNLFLRGIVPLIGYKSTSVYYDRAERFAGESKYPLKKMLAFAFDGITSFSVKPIRMVTSAGVIAIVVAAVMAIYSIITKILGNAAGWSTLMLSVWFIGGLQLVALGLIGEYVGKIYAEVKDRPRFIIETHKKNSL